MCKHSGSRRFATGCERTVLAILVSQLLDLGVSQTSGGLHSQGRQDLVYRPCEGVLHLSRVGGGWSLRERRRCEWRRQSKLRRLFGAGSRKRKPGLGGYEISGWSRSPGERTPACPGGEQVQPLRSRRNGWVLVVFSRKEEAAGGAAELKTHGSWNRSFNVSRTR